MFDFFDDNVVELFEDGENPTNKSDKFSIKSKLNKFYKNDKQVKRSKWLGASKAWDIDPSEFIYAYFVGLDQTSDFNSKMRMDFGTVAHKTIQDGIVGLGAMNPDSVEAFAIDRRNGMAGLIDGIVNPNMLLSSKKSVEEKEVLLEIKTCNDRIYESIFFPDDISEAYRAQAEIYQVATGIKKTLFVYVNSCSYAMKCLFYEYRGDLYEKVCKKADTIWDYIAKKELPEYKICTRDKWLELIKGVDVPLNRNDIDYSNRHGKKEEKTS